MLNKITRVTQVSFGVVNAFLIREQGMIWVDTGVMEPGRSYRDVFDKLAVNPESIGLIVITHGHSDHFIHVRELKELTGAPVACHRNAAHSLRTGENAPVVPRNELGRNVWSHIRGNIPLVSQTVEPDMIIDSSLNLNAYGISGQVIYTPGHTNCSLSVVLDSGEAVVGDMLVASPLDCTACMAYFAEDEAALFTSLHSLLDATHIFYSGHGGPFDKEMVAPLLQK